MDKGKLIDSFSDTMKKCNTDEDLCRYISRSINSSKIYKPEDYPALPRRRYEKSMLSISSKRTFEAAMSVAPGKKVCVLNFACGTHPGGGVNGGASAQEESLCRCSTLYPVIKKQSPFYLYNSVKKSEAYTDICIYSPEIVVIKKDLPIPEPLAKEDWGIIDVITCAAPDISSVRLTDYEQYELHKKRGRHILTICASRQVDTVVLGAFGCGAYHNNPKSVALAYRDIIPEFSGYFERVEFAIYCKDEQQKNLKEFRKVFSTDFNRKQELPT